MRAVHTDRSPHVGLSCLLSHLWHFRRFVFALCGHRTSISLHPFAPQALPCIFATMGALTPARLALRTLFKGNEHHPCPGRSPSLHDVPFHAFCHQPPYAPRHRFSAVHPAWRASEVSTDGFTISLQSGLRRE